VTVPLVIDTSVYLTALRDERFAIGFRERYARDIPRTFFSSVVVQELLAGARTLHHRRQAAGLYEPFERVRRIFFPTHAVWKDAGHVIAALAVKYPDLRSRLARGFLNDVLIALSARSIGAAVVTRNRDDFVLIRSLRNFSLELV
jgi:predicted nucleic acid-binding protein